jgi:sec-independent protein translocase protein TatB
MLDIAPTELLLVAFVALVVIGPKDLPKAMRVVGYWVGKARGVGRQFRAGFDAMVREAELEEMEKKWAEENARIMREHPATQGDEKPVEPGADQPSSPAVPADDQASLPLDDAPPVMVEKPQVDPAPDPEASPIDTGKAAS